ncbi:MAG: ATP-binding protein [Propionivibrio sp.]
MTTDNSSADVAALRERALAMADTAPSREHSEALSPDATVQMLHELRVHQIELEMQNEELRRAQVELDASRARYFELYDLAPVGYCTISDSGQVLRANLCAAGLLGVARGALVRQPISRFILKADQDILYRLRKQILATGEPQACDLRLQKNDGTTFWVQLVVSLAQEAEAAPELRVVINDISERKRVQAEGVAFDLALREKNVELEAARCAADKANRAKSEFLSSMSHELRTPLGAILGFAQLIESGTPPPTPSQKRSIDQILKAGWYLLELINEILDLALIDSGRVSLSLEPVVLAEVMNECESIIGVQGQKHDIDVTFPRFEIPYVVNADRTRLKQVLINLLSNAVKYNRADGTVSVECMPGDAGSLRISVSDTGVGLTPDQLAQLFQPFNRLGQEAKAEQGTGIGLIVSKRLIEMMGGVILVESTAGQGSVFSVELPLAVAGQAVPAALPCGDNVSPSIQAGATPRVLLYVEDNAANLMLVEEIIARRSDLRLLSAHDAKSGLELARNSQPDVILMDIKLPGISGLDALKILAGDPATAHIPVLALSANAVPKDIDRGLEAGFFGYLTKPIKVNEFLTTLDTALAHSLSRHANSEGTA